MESSPSYVSFALSALFISYLELEFKFKEEFGSPLQQPKCLNVISLINGHKFMQKNLKN